jgi:hypothetical protein
MGGAPSTQPGQRATATASAGSPARAGRGLGAPGCHPESPVTLWQSFLPQVEGTGHGATLWGLLMFSHALPARAGDQDKIVWRMTGTGLLTLQAIGPDGRHHRLAWGRTRTWAATGISREMSGARAMSSPRRAAGICAPSAATPPPMCGSASWRDESPGRTLRGPGVRTAHGGAGPGLMASAARSASMLSNGPCTPSQPDNSRVTIPDEFTGSPAMSGSAPLGHAQPVPTRWPVQALKYLPLLNCWPC